ncbi:uncharacterized protein LOC131431607 [Malaya genurostris]|uniref:uncharacterized protein LOC131431607 n=1 Tax=Malaya genurostris TaxID=325434 RepID=UPI0026F3CFBF|nr:uncharacterized protein LOC131431607 [Malaya genurostris]
MSKYTEYSDQRLCTSCFDAYGTCQTCTECGCLCCTSCSKEPTELISLFNAPSVLCRRCFCIRQSNEEIVHCEVHPDRCRDLYCLTCDMQICCDCFIKQSDHKRHTIDSVEVIYRQKLLETVEKFQQVPKHLKLIDWNTIRQADENLKMVEEVEQQILKDIHQLVQQQTSSMLARTAEKREILIRTKGIIGRTELQQREAMEQIQTLNTNNFLRLQESLNKRCDRILKDLEQLHLEPVRWDDIQCDLIPTCELRTVVFNISKDPVLEQKPVTIHLMDGCGIQWTVMFHLGPLTIGLEMYPNQMLKDFQFKTFVELSHATKINATGASFSFRESMARTELISIDKLHVGGYLSSDGDFILRIGVRPENILEENRLVKMLLLDQRKTKDLLLVEIAALENQNFILQADNLKAKSELNAVMASYESEVSNLKKEIAELKQAADECPTTPTSLGSFSSSPTDDAKQKLLLDLKRLQAKLDTMKISMKSMNPFAIGSFEIYRWSKEAKFYSPHLTSYNGITIYVVIQPNFISDTNSAVNAYICWAKGSKKKCEVFMEVVNEYEEKCVRENRMFDFSKGTSFSWKYVITHFDLFREGGFLGDDNLKIKFGLRPSLD